MVCYSWCWINLVEISLSFTYNSLFPLTFFSNNCKTLLLILFFLFFTWTPVHGCGALREESMGKKFRAAFSLRAMVLGSHFLVLVLWRQLLPYEFILNQMKQFCAWCCMLLIISVSSLAQCLTYISWRFLCSTKRRQDNRKSCFPLMFL